MRNLIIMGLAAMVLQSAGTSSAAASGGPDGRREERPRREFEADASDAQRRAKELTDALRLDGKGPSLESAGLEQVLAGEQEGAKATFERLLDTDKEGYRACMHLGSLLLVEGDYAGAAAVYSEGLRRNPAMADYWLRRRAEALLAMGRTEQALSDVEAALKGAPQSGGSLRQRSRILVVSGRLAEAARDYSASWAYSPRVPDTLDAFICGRLSQGGFKVEACGKRG